MSRIFGFLKNIYIKFMVWLGAAPPTGYEHLLPKAEAAKKPLPAPQASAPLLPPVATKPQPAPIAATPPPVQPKPIAAPVPIAEIAPQPKPIEPALSKDQAWLEAEKEISVTEIVEEEISPVVEHVQPPPLLPSVPVVVTPQPTVGEKEPAAEKPPLFQYTIQRGDTLTAIAKRFNTTLRQLIEVNQLKDPNRIFVGQKLTIPGMPGEAAPPLIVTEVITKEKAAPLPVLTETVRAVYLNYLEIGHQGSRQNIFKLLDSSTLNALVIDVKSDAGWVSYPTHHPLAQEIEANRPASKDFSAFIAQLKERGVYLIARIVVFRDTPLAKNRPDLAVKTLTGTLWQNGKEAYWVDPFQTAVWEYNIELAKEAARQGFDEIQFDYLYFPTDNQAGPPQFSKNITKETRVAAIGGFLSAARGQLKPFGVKLSARTFGYTCWRVDDTQIGQKLEEMAAYLDVLSPMLCPSTLDKGIPGFKVAVAHPYEVVHQSALRAVERVSSSGCQIRPWIQDFQDYRFDYRTYGKEEVQAQVKGCIDAGCAGFMAWNTKAQYTASAYTP